MPQSLGGTKGLIFGINIGMFMLLETFSPMAFDSLLERLCVLHFLSVSWSQSTHPNGLHVLLFLSTLTVLMQEFMTTAQH